MVNNPNSTNKYIPGSSEKKRAVMMYLLLGIILVSISKVELSAFEFAHFKQALGRRSIFILILLVSIVLLFIPFVRFLPILVILGSIILAVWFIKQAWDGKYYVLKQESPLFLFQGIGVRIVNVFDLNLHLSPEITQVSENIQDVTLEDK